MSININVNNELLIETNKGLRSREIHQMDLSHVPFSKFTVTITKNTDFNFAMNEVKKEFDRRGEKINPIEQIKIANKLIDNLKARKINYHIT
ncbi:MAG: hypothetical protein ACRCTZ_08050, partial [Sarcina sp.]